MKKKISGGDFFCGAGGFTEGAMQAVAELGGTVKDWLAINHWPRAIETHTKNHPEGRHLCVRLDQVRPEDAMRRGRMDILLASPECTGHSQALGDKPMNDQSRAGGWSIIDWANRGHIDTILVENVPQYRKWGPLNKNGRPVKQLRGQTFQAFLAALRAAGYTVDVQIFNAADYGDPTSRQRLVIQAQRTRPICWPAPSHAGRWRTAREIIDWSDHGERVDRMKRPLVAKTLARISNGRRKFGKQFILKYYGQGGAASIDAPLPTVTTKDRFALITVGRGGVVRYRMFHPREIAAAQGFPKAYFFTGNKSEIVKQIGNAVPVNLAKALVMAALGGSK